MSYAIKPHLQELDRHALREVINSDTIFRTGTTIIDGQEKPFVAKTGTVGDWAIYTGNTLLDGPQDIAMHGSKVIDRELIQRIVPCTDEALILYRY